MKKKNMGLIIAIIVVAIMIVAVGAIAILYFMTDIFKSNQEMFWQYFSSNSKMAEMIISENETNQEEWKKNNSYTSEGNLKLAITEESGTQEFNIGTTSQYNHTNGRTYSDATLKNNDNSELFKISYIHSGDIYAVNSKDIYEPYYIGFRNSNLKEFATKLGFPAEIVTQMPDAIPLEMVETSSALSEEECKYLLDTYSNLFMSKIAPEKYAKLEEKDILVHEKSYKAGGTSLTLNQEDIKQIMVAVITKAQEDEKTIAILNNLLAEAGEEVDAVEVLGEMLESIQGAKWSETTITISVYHVGKQIVKTQIDINHQIEVVIDLDLTQENKQYADIAVATVESERQEVLKLSVQKQAFDNMVNYTINIHTLTGYEMIMTTSVGKVINGQIENNSKITIMEENATIESTYHKTIKQATQNVEIQELTNSNAVIINNYPVEQLTTFFEGIGNTAATALQDKFGKLNIQIQGQEDVAYYIEGIVSSLLTVANGNAVPQPFGIVGMVLTTNISLKNQNLVNRGLLNPSNSTDQNPIDSEKQNSNSMESAITQMEQQAVQAFNSKFEMYKGENISGANVRTLLSTISSNNTAYAGEDAKTITVKLGGTNIQKPEGWTETGENDVTKILALRKSIFAGHKYKVVMEQNSEGYIHTIIITDNN